MRMQLRNAGPLLLALICAAPGAVLAAPHVYILLIDGLDARRVNESLTPTLWGLAHGAAGPSTFYPDGCAVMPAVTNTNHAAVMTAAYAGAHGIVGNWFWDRDPQHAATPSESAHYLQVETLFTVIEKERPALTTAGVFGKARLVDLFAAVPKQQRAPDILWGDLASETEPVDARAGFASDQRTMDEVLSTIAARDPDFMFAALPDVDRTAHLFGPDSNEARKAELEADRQLRRLVDFLQRRGAWARTILMITADHGFTSVEPSRSVGRLYPLVLFGRELTRAGLGGLTAVSNGTIEALTLPGPVPQSVTVSVGQRLAAVRALALAQPEIAEAWYRLPNPADGDDAFTLSRAHPDWHMDHPRAGDLTLVAKPHYHFGDPFSPRAAGMPGNHGGPDETHIPILITGGGARLRAQVVSQDVPAAHTPDLGATAAWLLGLRSPRTLDGKLVRNALGGRILREAFE